MTADDLTQRKDEPLGAGALSLSWLLAVLVIQGLPNPLVYYADDMAMVRGFSLPFLYLPLG